MRRLLRAGWPGGHQAGWSATGLAMVLGLHALAEAQPTPGAPGPALTVLSPKDGRASIAAPQFHLLGRTVPGATVSVGGTPVTVHATGVFARDNIPLAPGANRPTIEVTLPDGQRLSQVLEIERSAAPAAPGRTPLPGDRLAAERDSAEPRQPLRVAPGEPIEVALRASAGAMVEARLPGQAWQALKPSDADPERYHGHLAFEPGPDTEPAAVEFRVRPGAAVAQGRTAVAQGRAARRAPASARALHLRSPADVAHWNPSPARLHVAGPDGAELLHGRHEVRLGGPFIAELAPGTLLRVIGLAGDHYRVRLAADTTAWVLRERLAPAPMGTRVPHAQFTSLSVQGSAAGDVVAIPVPEHLPYALNAAATAPGQPARLELDLFGAHRATTWITHRASAALVREVTVEQPADGRVRVSIALHSPRLWGWRVEREPGLLKIHIRPAPAPSAQGSPLAGLHLALEPGHGSTENLGAVGATGIPEKDVNRWTVEALKAELERVGARVTVVREGDENPPHVERVRRVMAAGADLFVSVHANASDTSRGFLRTRGTSSYYKHAPSRDLAAAVHRRMLEHTGLEDFGLVGAFNYHPIRRITWMPAILLEQAFMSHPADEAAMLDAAFRARTAEAVRLGLEDFLRGR